jgi:hypothetical protein
LAIARKKEEEGGSDFQGGLTGFGAQPNFQRKLPDGRVQTHTVIPKVPDYEVGNHPHPVFEPDNLSDVLDDQLEVFLRGFRLGVNALAVEN